MAQRLARSSGGGGRRCHGWCANKAQVRRADLLDEVLTQQTSELSAIDDAHDIDLPTIVDLLACEERVSESLVQDLRRES